MLLKEIIRCVLPVAEMSRRKLGLSGAEQAAWDCHSRWWQSKDSTASLLAPTINSGSQTALANTISFQPQNSSST